MDVKPLELKKDLMLDDCLIKAGTLLDVEKTTRDSYTVFHHTGWWSMSSEYFKEE